jgi:hypothetical protein
VTGLREQIAAMDGAHECWDGDNFIERHNDLLDRAAVLAIVDRAALSGSSTDAAHPENSASYWKALWETAMSTIDRLERSGSSTAPLDRLREAEHTALHAYLLGKLTEQDPKVTYGLYQDLVEAHDAVAVALSAATSPEPAQPDRA